MVYNTPGVIITLPQMNRKVCMLCASIVNNSIAGEKKHLNVTPLNGCVTFATMEMPDIPLL